MPSLQGVFDAPGPVADAAKRLRHRGFTDLEIYAPAAFPELDDALDEKPSRVRLYTFIGGLLGVTTGYAVTIWMSLDWPIVIDVVGKDGKVEKWAWETGGANALYRRGWRKDDLVAGTVVVVDGFRARNGSKTANATSITFPDGRRLFAGSSKAGAK